MEQTPEEQTLVMAKSTVKRLDFALMLLFYRTRGRFPNLPEELDVDAIELVAQQLGVDPTSRSLFKAAGRTWKRHRAKIRAFFGYRVSTVADAEMLSRVAS